MVCCTANCQKWTTFSLSGLFIIIGILIAVFWDGLFHSILTHELSVANSRTKGFTIWRETPIPMYLEFYLFNWTNPEQANNASAKPNFVELGPYTYYEHHIRENITFNDNNTVTFLNKRLWRYLPEKSVGSLNDSITTLNPIIVTIANMVKDKHKLVRRGVNFFLKEKHETLAITKTVEEFIFEGYTDKILDLAHKLNISGFNVPYTKFGWFVDRNGSAIYDGVFNMFTGDDTIEKLGLLNTWNYEKQVPFFRDTCGDVNGTTGELWYPPNDQESIKLFASDLCSTVELKKNGSYMINGVEGNKYIGTDKIFDNGTQYPEMECFVPEGVQQSSGVRNVSLCKFGSPAFVSYAHFYLADPSYRKSITGMKPDPDKHQMFIVLEPSTGTPLKVQAIFQINLHMEPVEGIDALANVKTTLMPAFWFKQSATITDNLSNQVKLMLVLPAAVTNTGYGILGIGILLVIIGSFLTYKKAWRGSEEERLLNQQSL